MLKKNKFQIILIAIIIMLVVLLMSGKIVYPVKSNSLPLEVNDLHEYMTPYFLNTSFSDEPAPEISNKGKWINTDKDITMNDLRGKVVLIEFWTFGCYNCTNTLPYLKEWYDKYRSEDFEMIGIHCPEFDNERNYDNVKSSVEKLGIEYPVLTDNDFSVWKKFDVHAWPTIFLIDKYGEIRYKKVGEGKYDKTERIIQELLAEKYSSAK
ncbi:MAG TPA: redoxin domain-containing protein [Ignavibacteria bacterium]|nr:redoxin domain-containing protein [Ignavibacteria bacterium]